MNSTADKPKLVFFQFRYDKNLPEFLLIHKRDHVKCLSEFFDVTVIHDDCDYQQTCEKHTPDLVLFESGVNHETCRRPTITNIRASLEVPRVALHNADAWCNARAGFLSDMDHWQIDTFFSICTTAAEHTPEIAQNLFVWPNFVDPEVYRDYHQWKSIPVLLTGNQNAIYPWRQRINRLLAGHYPALISPHPGYTPNSKSYFMHGEKYARTINASSFVPTCGTVAKEFVRKHLEIPACKSCLITEDSPAVRAAGFVDMHNCVFGEESTILDKLAYLFAHPEELAAITERGHDLVQSQHTLKQRDQILQWYTLNKALKPNQAIVQAGPFGQLSVVDRSSGVDTYHITGGGMHLRLLHEADAQLRAGKYHAADSLYRKCMTYMPWMPEPRFRIALCRLYQGDPKAARTWITQLLQFILVDYRAVDPDPVEWAYYIVSLLCLGDLGRAARYARKFPNLRHPELDRTRWVVEMLQHGNHPRLIERQYEQKPRRTIHRLPERNVQDWLQHICIMLTACKQSRFADALLSSPKALPSPPERNVATSTRAVTRSQKAFARLADLKSVVAPLNGDIFPHLRRRQLYSQVGSRLKRWIVSVLHRLEAKYGYFLPYGISEMRNDEFFHEIRRLTREADIRNAVIFGAAKGEGATEAVLAGMSENRNRPTAFCINGPTRRFARLKKALASNPLVRFSDLSVSSSQDCARGLRETVRRIKRENEITAFDVALVDGSHLTYGDRSSEELRPELHIAKFVFLNNISNFSYYENHKGLVDAPEYALLASNPSIRDGYAIFARGSDTALALKEARF